MKLHEALQASEYRSAFIKYDDFCTYVEGSFCDGRYEIATVLKGHLEPLESQRVGDVKEVRRILQAMDLDLDEWQPKGGMIQFSRLEG